MNRREFFKFLGASSLLLYTGSLLTSCGGGSDNTTIANNTSQDTNTQPSFPSGTKNPLYIPQEGSDGLFGYYRPQGRFTLTAESSYHEILKGKQTRLLTYQITENGKTYYNPIIVLRNGDNFEVDFVNKIGEKSIIHWHGFRADWESDGHPGYAIANGEIYTYPKPNTVPFTIIDRSGTYFYHPHPHGRTGYQVYMGLAGMIIIEDADEDKLKKALDLQYGITDIPLIIQDKTFNSDGSLNYNPLGMNGIMGFWGETVLVNLTPNPYMEVERRIYRFRLLNGSNARPYRLVLLRGSQRMRFWVIGVEGGLLDKPYEVDEILIAPGERIDILIDFRDANTGDVLKLYSLQHNLVMMGGMGMNSELINREFEVLEFRVVRDSSYDRSIPQELSTVYPIDTRNATRLTINLGMGMGRFTINGDVWDENNPLADYGYNFSNGEIVEITFINNTNMYHPMHLHGFQFQILERFKGQQRATEGGQLRATDKGWKDTVIVGPNETVKIAVDMSHNFGREQIYLLHCHILEHHDAGMMVNYRVRA